MPQEGALSKMLKLAVTLAVLVPVSAFAHKSPGTVHVHEDLIQAQHETSTLMNADNKFVTDYRAQSIHRHTALPQNMSHESEGGCETSVSVKHSVLADLQSKKSGHSVLSLVAADTDSSVAC